MKYILVVLIALLFISCGGSGTVDFSEQGGVWSIKYEVKNTSIVNRYTANHEVTFPRKEFGVYSSEEIVLRDLNGGAKLDMDGGYVAIYSNEVEIRLYSKSKSSPALLLYPGNGSYSL